MDELELCKGLEKGLTDPERGLVTRIVRDNEYSANFILSVSSTLHERFASSIHAGVIPEVIYSSRFIYDCMINNNERLRFVINETQRRVDKMEHSLMNVPTRSVLSMRTDGRKRFVEPVRQEFVDDSERFVTKYSITVLDAETEQTVSRTVTEYKYINEARRLCAKGLAEILSMSRPASLPDSIRDTEKEQRIPEKISVISIEPLNSTTVRTHYEYESNEVRQPPASDSSGDTSDSSGTSSFAKD